MKKKDYEKIAEIIRSKIKNSSNNQNKIIMLFQIAKELADYFEETDTKCNCGNCPRWFRESLFNRKQFLKDCGVKE